MMLLKLFQIRVLDFQQYILMIAQNTQNAQNLLQKNTSGSEDWMEVQSREISRELLTVRAEWQEHELILLLYTFEIFH